MEHLNAKQTYELVDTLICMEAFQNAFSERPILTSGMRVYTEGVWSADFFEDEGYEVEENPGRVYVDYLGGYITFTSDLIFIRLKVLSIPFLMFQEVLDTDEEGYVLKGTEEEIKDFNSKIAEYESFNKK